jgi:hypothetical protein
MTYPFRVPLVCILPRLRDSVTDQMLSPGDTFWASADRAAEVIAIGAATLLDDSDAVIEAVAAFADDPAIVRLYEYRAERALIEAWRSGMKPD